MSHSVNSVARPQRLQTTVCPCAAPADTKASQWSGPCTRRTAPILPRTSRVRYTVVSPNSGQRERAASKTWSALRLHSGLRDGVDDRAPLSREAQAALGEAARYGVRVESHETSVTERLKVKTVFSWRGSIAAAQDSATGGRHGSHGCREGKSARRGQCLCA